MAFRIGLLTKTLMAAGCMAGAMAAVHADTVKVGVLLPMTGPNAAFGRTSLNGMQMAVEDFNAKGGVKSLGGAKIELVIADTPSPNTTAQSTQRLISRERVAAVLGSFASSTTIAAMEVTERAGVPLVTFSFADELTERGYKNIFKVTPHASAMGRAQFDYSLALAKEAGEEVKTVAILYEDTAYGTAQARGLRDAANEAGIKIVLDEAYPLGITDATPLVNKVRVSQADMVFPVSYLNDSMLIIRTMRQQNVTAPMIGGAAGYIIPDFKAALGEYAEGVLSVSTAADDYVPEMREKYEAKHGTIMPHDALLYAAGAEALFLAIDKAGSAAPAKVREALTEIKHCENFAKASPSGCIEFDETGLNAGTFPIMVQWRGDQLVTVYPLEIATQKVLWPEGK